MRPAWRVLLIAVVLLLLVLVPRLPATRAAAGDTAIAEYGEFRDMVLDPGRGRLYVTDAVTYGTHGVVVFDLETHALLARLPLDEPAGLDMSPDGSHLAVASMDGSVGLVELGTLTWGTTVYFNEGSSVAMAWDVGFIDSSRVIVTMAQYYGQSGGYHQALVVNFTSASVEGWFGPSPWAFTAFATVHTDVSRHRAYLVDGDNSPPTAYVYDVASGMPTLLLSRGDANFTSHSTISSDGTTLYFTTGRVYDAATLTFQRDLMDTGEVDPGTTGAFVFFASGPHVDMVRPIDAARIARFSFGGLVPDGYPLYDRIRGLVVDESRDTVYLISDPYYDDRVLRAVPLVSALLDPMPADGTLYRESPAAASVVISGNASPAAFQMVVDGNVVLTAFDPDLSRLSYVSASVFTEGQHHVTVSGTDALGVPLSLDWNFSVDSQPPQILLDPVPEVTRTPQLNLTGHILDPNFRQAWVRDGDLPVDPIDGSFRATVNLSEGWNLVGVQAEDALQHMSFTAVAVLFVPPTTRLVHEQGSFSLECPSNWSASRDVGVGDARFDLLVNASYGGFIAANVGVSSTGPMSNVSESLLLSAARQVIANLSSFPGFGLVDFPHAAVIRNLTAVTYSMTYGRDPNIVYQRQYLVATPDGAHSWVLTFTTGYSRSPQYDPLFEWIARTLREETTVVSLPALLFLIVGSSAAVAAVAAAILLLLWRRRVKQAGSAGPSEARVRNETRTDSGTETVGSLPPKPPAGPQG